MTFDRPASAHPRRRHLLKGAAGETACATAPAVELRRHSGWAAVNEPPGRSTLVAPMPSGRVADIVHAVRALLREGGA